MAFTTYNIANSTIGDISGYQRIVSSANNHMIIIRESAGELCVVSDNRFNVISLTIQGLTRSPSNSSFTGTIVVETRGGGSPGQIRSNGSGDFQGNAWPITVTQSGSPANTFTISTTSTRFTGIIYVSSTIYSAPGSVISYGGDPA